MKSDNEASGIKSARKLEREDSWITFELPHDNHFAVFRPATVQEKVNSPSRDVGEVTRPQSRSNELARPESRSSLAETLSASRRMAGNDWSSAWEEVDEVEDGDDKLGE